jgi:hypothetical protein
MRVVNRLVLACALICGAAEAGHAQNLITGGGFEDPIVTSGTFTTFGTGERFSAWKVTGGLGNVAIVSGTFTKNGFTFPAHSGQQSLDLTGTTNTPTGFQQTVTTTPGSVYKLTFWVGNVYDPTGFFGTGSTVNVFVNGQLLTSVINTHGKGKSFLVWRQFSATFTASTTTTTVTFINADPPTDNVNELDDVALELVP